MFLAGVSAPFLVLDDVPAHWPVMLWATIVLEGLLLWCGWVFVLQAPAIRRRYLGVAHWFDLAFGIVLLVLAVVILIT